MSLCNQVKTQYETIKNLAQEYLIALKSKNPEQTKILHAKLEQERSVLKEMIWSLEKLPLKELKEQYEDHKEILKRVGILETISNGELGIKRIDNIEESYPSFSEVKRKMFKNKEMLKIKTKQGLNFPLIVPFGMKLDDLIEKYKQVILKHHREGKLFATKENPSDPDESLGLNESQPIYVWDKYQNADVSGELVYFPKKFSSNHNGKTKQQVLKEQGGFTISLIENLPNIPRQDKGKIIEGRKQIEAGKSPNDYLKMLKDPQYQHETGMTPEEQIIYAIIHLEQTNQVIDDYSGKGSVSYQLGAYFSSDIHVPSAYWYRVDRWASLVRRGPDNSGSVIGVRGAVRVV